MRIGNKELEILTYIAEREGVKAAEVVSFFEQRDGIKRTTVLKAVDRLMAKGFLVRDGQWGEYTYRSKVATADVQNALTQQFVRETLGGSITPFVAYLSGGAQLSEDDIKELRAVLDKMEEEKK
jgi:predicted transcriptional regulator